MSEIKLQYSNYCISLGTTTIYQNSVIDAQRYSHNMREQLENRITQEYLSDHQIFQLIYQTSQYYT